MAKAIKVSNEVYAKLTFLKRVLTGRLRESFDKEISYNDVVYWMLKQLGYIREYGVRNARGKQ